MPGGCAQKLEEVAGRPPAVAGTRDGAGRHEQRLELGHGAPIGRGSGQGAVVDQLSKRPDRGVLVGEPGEDQLADDARRVLGLGQTARETSWRTGRGSGRHPGRVAHAGPPRPAGAPVAARSPRSARRAGARSRGGGSAPPRPRTGRRPRPALGRHSSGPRRPGTSGRPRGRCRRGCPVGAASDAYRSCAVRAIRIAAGSRGLTSADSCVEQLEDPAQGDLDPARPVVQLVDELVARLLEHERAQQRRPFGVVRGQERRVSPRPRDTRPGTSPRPSGSRP